MSKEIKDWSDIADEKLIVHHEDGISGILVQTVQYWNPYRNMYVNAYLVHCDDVGEEEDGLALWMDHEVVEIKTPNQHIRDGYMEEDDDYETEEIDEEKKSILEKAKTLLG